jgi:hypothetical protein
MPRADAPVRHFIREGDALIVYPDYPDYTYTVALRDGHLPVVVCDQGCSPWMQGEELVSLDSLERGVKPRWGQGWQIVDTTGRSQWFLTHWDSSD